MARGPDSEPRLGEAIRRAKEGDREALWYLYIRYADAVFGFVSTVLRDESEAEDITQNVFLKLMTNIKQYEERDTPFLAWLLRVSRNVAVDHMRQLRLVPCAEVFDSETKDERDVHEQSTLLREALGRLPADQSKVLVLRHLAGMKPPEIAALLSRSEPSIHALHHRARTALRKELAALQSGPMVRDRRPSTPTVAPR